MAGLLFFCGPGLLLAGCSGPPAAGRVGLDAASDHAPAEALYVDWDEHDFHLDRYLQINLRDLAVSMDRDHRDLSDVYRQAVTDEAAWDSIGLDLHSRLNRAEQTQRRRLATRHHDRARSLLLGVIHHHRNWLARGLLPDFTPVGMIDRHEGVETVVTTALKHLTRATATDPSLAAAWRDLAYFSGVAGDRDRQERALNAALAALEAPGRGPRDTDDHGRLRRDILLDLAWLVRASGRLDLAIAHLDRLEPWLGTPAPEADLRLYEALLLRGLALADRGDRREANRIARELPALRLPVRAIRALKREDLHWHISIPNSGELGFMRSAWPRRESNFGRQWIRAALEAASGDPRRAARLLHAPPTDLELPSRLAWRYWQERGRLHDLANEGHEAIRCYQRAAQYRPYLAFFPLRASDGAPRLGEFGFVRRYYAGYGLFFLCGDPELWQSDHPSAMTAEMAGQQAGRR